ncbi:MAG TPA: urate oxidase [Candidatus Acidoferrales bacterium]|nr:urate oxidase [Candidatus Acidoferrales bacterium]
MTIELAQNDYGESRIRLLRVMHRGGLHEVKDLTLSVRLEGAFEAAHVKGENRAILPSDTIKNTVYVLAKQYPAEAIEEFAFHLTEHFLTYNPQVARIEVRISERPWSRVTIGEKGHASAFVGRASEKRTTRISAGREALALESGIEDLLVMRTSGMAFEGFLRDPYTTLEESKQRVLSTALNAAWSYEFPEPEMPFSTMWHGVRKTLLETFAAHESKSVQNTIHVLGQAVLENFEAISEIRLSMPDNYCSPVNLKPFGMENENEVFAPLQEPQGTAAATLRRRKSV